MNLKDNGKPYDAYKISVVALTDTGKVRFVLVEVRTGRIEQRFGREVVCLLHLEGLQDRIKTFVPFWRI